MRKKTIAVLLAILMMLSVAACESRTELPPSSPGSETAPAPTVMPQAQLAAKEAGEMAYEHASAQYEEKLYLCEVKAGGTVVVTHQKGHGAVEGGYEDTWSVVLHRRDSESIYTQILVGIRENEVASCNEAGTFGVSGGSWERHTEARFCLHLVDSLFIILICRDIKGIKLVFLTIGWLTILKVFFGNGLLLLPLKLSIT